VVCGEVKMKRMRLYCRQMTAGMVLVMGHNSCASAA
jgi:hypothetical protein